MKILIADDHSVFRHGLKDILARQFPGAAFGEAETGQAALEQVWQKHWDVVVLDVTMPGRSGVEILKEIKQTRPKLPVLMLSMHAEEQYGVRVLEAGAAGYVTKLRAPHEVVDAIQRVLAGGKYVTPAIAEKLINRLQTSSRKLPHERLSHREYQVLQMIASGESMKQIAQQLSVSPQTISTHRARMLKKLALHSTAGLIRYAVQNRLVD
jgi:DNA-binding NarL/FixJ family response regulator